MENKINYEEILTSLIEKKRNITGKDIQAILVEQGYICLNGKLLPIDELPFKVGDYVVRITDSKVIYKVTDIDYINGFFYLDNNKYLPFEFSRRNEFRLVPKFKFEVSDWISDGNVTVQITGINFKNSAYEIQYKDYSPGGCYSKDFIESKYHLWSIRDAKKGDVIYLKGCQEWLICFDCFRNNKEDGIKDGISRTFSFNLENSIINTDDEIWGTPDLIINSHPASKFQLKLLTKKLEEEGLFLSPISFKLESIEEIVKGPAKKWTWTETDSHTLKWIEEDIKKLYANNMKSQSLYYRELDFLATLNPDIKKLAPTKEELRAINNMINHNPYNKIQLKHLVEKLNKLYGS